MRMTDTEKSGQSYRVCRKQKELGYVLKYRRKAKALRGCSQTEGHALNEAGVLQKQEIM